MSSNVLIYNTTAKDATFAAGATIAGTSAATNAPPLNAIQTAAVNFETPRSATWLARLSAQLATATSAGSLDVYVGWGAAASGPFPGNLGSAAGPYLGYATATASTPNVLAGINQLEYVGSLNVANVATLQTMDLGVLVPKLQYGIFVLANNTAQSVGSATLASVTLTPVVDQAQ